MLQNVHVCSVVLTKSGTLGLRSLHNAACWIFFKLGGRAGGKAWWRASPTMTLSERQENQCRGLRLQPNVGGLTAMSYHGRLIAKNNLVFKNFHMKNTHTFLHIYPSTRSHHVNLAMQAQQRPPAVSAVLQCSTNVYHALGQLPSWEGELEVTWR